MNSDLHILEQQIYTLNERIEQLNQRITSLEQAGKTPETISKDIPTSPSVPAHSPQESLLELDSSSLLKNISILCFLLVIALGFRALADNEILDPRLGAIFGIFYASGIIGGGHFLYRKTNSLGPLFSITGALLMFSIVVETHERFASLPGIIVYYILAGTGISLAYISYRNKVALPVIVGSLGMCSAAIIIDYPTPYFPSLILILWVANILGFFASRIKNCSWLRWILLILTHLVLQTWGLKITGISIGSKSQPQTLATDLFIPMVILIGVTFTAIALFGIIRSGNQRITKFDYSLPTVNAAWCYVAGIYSLKNPAMFSAPAALAALAYFGLAYWLSTRVASNSQGTNTFVAGGLILACLSLPALLGSFIYPLPILASFAYASGYYSWRWGSGGMRLSALIMHVYLAAVLSISATGHLQTNQTAMLVIPFFCGIIALYHFRFCRINPPPATSLYFQKYDKSDKGALLIFFAGLTDLFFGFQAMLDILLSYLQVKQIAVIATGIESTVINFAAMIIMAMSYRKRNLEIRNAAIVILMVGGAKVLLFDLFHISGAWLVASIMSVGIAAAFASFTLTRWNRQPSTPNKEATPLETVEPLPAVSQEAPR